MIPTKSRQTYLGQSASPLRQSPPRLGGDDMGRQEYSPGGEFLDLVGGWATPMKKYEFASWDDEIPNMSGKKNENGPNHQPAMLLDQSS